MISGDHIDCDRCAKAIGDSPTNPMCTNERELDDYIICETCFCKMYKRLPNPDEQSFSIPEGESHA